MRRSLYESLAGLIRLAIDKLGLLPLDQVIYAASRIACSLPDGFGDFAGAGRQGQKTSRLLRERLLPSLLSESSGIELAEYPVYWQPRRHRGLALELTADRPRQPFPMAALLELLDPHLKRAKAGKPRPFLIDSRRKSEFEALQNASKLGFFTAASVIAPRFLFETSESDRVIQTWHSSTEGHYRPDLLTAEFARNGYQTVTIVAIGMSDPVQNAAELCPYLESIDSACRRNGDVLELHAPRYGQLPWTDGMLKHFRDRTHANLLQRDGATMRQLDVSHFTADTSVASPSLEWLANAALNDPDHPEILDPNGEPVTRPQAFELQDSVLRPR